MNLFDTSFGIDFRKNHLVLTLLKGLFGKIKLVGFEIHPLPPEEQAAEDRSAQVLGLINQFISHAVNRENLHFDPKGKSICPVHPASFGNQREPEEGVRIRDQQILSV
jgi:hypothetical protein